MTPVLVVLALRKDHHRPRVHGHAAGIATWADRRQSAMVQDRMGPNRAVINLTVEPGARSYLAARALRPARGVRCGAGALAAAAHGRAAMESITLAIQSSHPDRMGEPGCPDGPRAQDRPDEQRRGAARGRGSAVDLLRRPLAARGGLSSSPA